MLSLCADIHLIIGKNLNDKDKIAMFDASVAHLISDNRFNQSLHMLYI
uniref:Uncharacterized protein n=1 Tax=viral metagenome TaxID=1070528 RepID=A0A6C0C9P8_9ZZZZ